MKKGLPLDVLGLGCVAVDDLVFVPHQPVPDSKLQISRRERHCGGLTAMALVAAARLGCHCAYAGALGADADSRFVLEALKQAGVETRHVVPRRDVRPVRSVIVVDDETGARTILYDVSQALGADPRRPARDLIASTRVLLVDRWGLPGMIRAARIAREAGVPIVADFETFELPRFAELFALADHLIVSENFAQRYTGARDPAAGVQRLWGRERVVVVVTCGSRGCWWLDATQESPQHLPAFKVKAVNTTGCGDVFHGAYAAALARQLPLLERLRIASAAAALKAAGPGTPRGLPGWSALQKFLSSRAGS